MKSKSGVPERLKTHYSGDKKVIANTLIPSNKITHPPPPPHPPSSTYQTGVNETVCQSTGERRQFF